MELRSCRCSLTVFVISNVHSWLDDMSMRMGKIRGRCVAILSWIEILIDGLLVMLVVVVIVVWRMWCSVLPLPLLYVQVSGKFRELQGTFEVCVGIGPLWYEMNM